MKFLKIFMVLCLHSTMLFGQAYFNNTYNTDERYSFYRNMHILSNGNILTMGRATLASNYSISGFLFREVDLSGNIVWEDFLESPIDTINLYTNWKHNNFILGDTMLITFGTAQDENVTVTMPYYLSYHLKEKKIVNFKTYRKRNYATIYSSKLHHDGFIYTGGYLSSRETFFDPVVYRNINKRKWLYMKFDIQGNMIWQKEMEINDYSMIFEVESIPDGLLLVGSDVKTGEFELDGYTSIAKIDTAGNMLKYIKPVKAASHGTNEVEFYKGELYFTTRSKIRLDSVETSYLAKLDTNLNIEWEHYIPNSSTYGIVYRRMRIFNDQIVIAANITRATRYTSNRVWSYGAGFNLQGALQWEHAYHYHPRSVHHIDNIEVTANGDLVFLGTVFNLTDNTQDLWLFSTDSQGCGVVQDTCYYTLEQYFGLDTMVSVNEQILTDGNRIEIRGNPFDNQLILQQAVAGKPKQVSITNTAGQLVYTNELIEKLQLNTTNWQSGIYLLQVYENGALVSVDKLVKQ